MRLSLRNGLSRRRPAACWRTLNVGLLLVAVSTGLPTVAEAQVAPAAVVAAPVKPKLAVAIILGRTLSNETGTQADADRADTIGLALKFRLFGVEAWVEIGKAEFDNSDRIDRQLGLSLYHRIGSDRLAPYLHLGGGINVSAPLAGTDIRADQIYSEIGGGLSYRLSARLDATADYSLGRRWWLGTRGGDLLYRADLTYLPVPHDESYRQIRVGLRIAF